MSFHIQGTLLRHCLACSNKSKNMPKFLAALFVFKIKGHKQKLFMLQAHKSECNIFQLHMSWWNILAPGKIRKVTSVTEQLWSGVAKDSQENTKIAFWAGQHFSFGIPLSGFFGFTDILLGSSISLCSGYIEISAITPNLIHLPLNKRLRRERIKWETCDVRTFLCAKCHHIFYKKYLQKTKLI